MKALSVSIFESKRIGNCSNHGISEKYDDVLLLTEDGYIDIDMNNPPENLCMIVKKRIGWHEVEFVRPYAEPEGAGWMYGGSLIYSSDSRFPSDKPLLLHDRQE